MEKTALPRNPNQDLEQPVAMEIAMASSMTSAGLKIG